MKTRYFYFIGAALLLAGCNKEMVDADQIVGVKTVLEVGLPDSKTYMGENEGGSRSVYWSNGDQIAVNGVASEELAELPAGTRSTTFTIEGVLTPPYKIIYPASIYKDATHVTLPAVQTYKAGGFADGMFPMAGYTADGSDITLNHLCALVKISVLRASGDGADTDKIACVRFKGRNAERVSGTFEIDYPNTALVNDAGTGTGLEVRVVKSLATSTTTAVDYYLVVPAREYENGFDVIVQDVNGHIMTKSKTESKTFAAGHFYKMAAFEFVPTGTELGVEISNAEELIAFATAYNNEEYEPLGGNFLATVTDDIVFDPASSALYDATGGIGCVISDTETNYFNGVFDGGNHTISGLTATVPLFAYTGGGGTIKNLTLDSTCSFTVNTGSGSNHGALVGRNKGAVMDCTSNASFVINNMQDVTSASQYYGGLVGYNPGGTVDGCTVTGDITCSQTGLTLTKNSICIGGIVGYQSSDGGTIDDCRFTGNITVSDNTTYGGITAKGLYIYVGGILGYANKCVVTDCRAGIDGTSRTIDIRGTFVPGIGGILGWNANAESSQICRDTNYVSISFASSGARADTTPCRLAGVVSRTTTPVSQCYNYGAIASSCNSTTLTLGGIVGESAGANVSNCINYAGGTLTRSNADQTAAQANRYFALGGILGRLASAAADVKDCSNFAAILSNNPGTSTGTTIDLGGIVGYAEQQIDISGCKNKGGITNTVTSDAVLARMTLGGIMAYGSTANTTISSCDNLGQVYCNAQTSANNRLSYSGGIVGLLAKYNAAVTGVPASVEGIGGLEISHCTDSVRVWNRNYNITYDDVVKSPFGGGIVGVVIGTTASKANIHDCSTSGGDVVELRGFCGGIAGYAESATLTNNTVAQALTGSNKNAQGVGGIVGWAVGTSITNCSSTASINAVKQIGGLVSILGESSSISNSRVNGVTLSKGTGSGATNPAVLVNSAASGTTITGCGVKGTLAGAAITLSSNMVTTNGGATVSGTYLLD